MTVEVARAVVNTAGRTKKIFPKKISRKNFVGELLIFSAALLVCIKKIF